MILLAFSSIFFFFANYYSCLATSDLILSSSALSFDLLSRIQNVPNMTVNTIYQKNLENISSLISGYYFFRSSEDGTAWGYFVSS